MKTEYNINCNDPIDEILSRDQIERSANWMKKHRHHVCNLIMNVNKSFPPTLKEDKSNPNLWKPGHWRWFLDQTLNKLRL